MPLQQEKLASMLQQVSDGAERVMEGTADESLDELMAELDGEVGGGVTESGSGGLKDVMKDLDAAIAKGEQAARNAQAARGAARRGGRARRENVAATRNSRHSQGLPGRRAAAVAGRPWFSIAA